MDIIFFVLILFLNCEVYKAADPDCKSNPCQNKGTCSSPPGNNGYYSCLCQDGYYGIACEKRNEITTSTESVIQPTSSAPITPVIQPTPSTSTAPAIQRTPSISAASAIQRTPSTSAASAIQHTPSTSLASAIQRTPSTLTASAIQRTPSTSATSAIHTTPSTPTASSINPTTSTASVIKTSALTSTVPPKEILATQSTHTTFSSGPLVSPTDIANQRLKGDKITVVVSVTIPVVVVVICAVILGVCLIRRWKRKKGLGTTALERAPGISISNTSYGDHQLNISKTSANGHATDVASNEYAEIVANGNPVDEQADGYYTINDVPKISQTNNTNYAHVNTHKALMPNSNYSHIENNNKEVSKAGDYGVSKLKRGIFQLKKSSKKKYTDSSYDNLEMKTVAYDPNKNVEDVAMTELESEYNHTHAGVPESIKKDIQNEKDEYSHLNYKPKSMNSQAHVVANENPYLGGQSQLTSELLENLRANEQESENGVRHDFFVLEVIGESGDDSIKESDMSKFEEGNSNRASGFQYECAREIERSGTHKNEEASDIQSACHYERSKDIDTNIDIASKPADVDDRLGTYSATDDENQNHHYFILSKT